MPERTCSIPDCGKPARTRTWCEMHYYRWYRHGDPLIATLDPAVKLARRFWAKVDQRPDDCWPWLASHFYTGYGQFRVNGTMTVAHRVAYELTYGPLSKGLVLDHLCGRKDCCNPRHLDPVSQGENVQRSYIRRAAPGTE